MQKVGHSIMRGEYHYRREEYNLAFEHLREANKRYDNLNYDEPWGYMMPTRHVSGALLLEQGILTDDKKLIKEAE